MGRTLLTGGGSDLQWPLQQRRPRQRLRPRLLRLNGGLGGYDHGNGYDHDCYGSTTAAITTLAMVTIAAPMATIAEPMSVLDRPPPPTANFINWGCLLTRGLGYSLRAVPTYLRKCYGSRSPEEAVMERRPWGYTWGCHGSRSREKTIMRMPWGYTW